ncbi:MAG: hypothetical protein GTO14_04715 [Anaerolineales bacterium]|nr:hypothetical protein [Anaerolineales bacterium]
MTIFDETTDVLAPPSLVWQEAYKLARRGRITHEEPNRFLVATQLKMGYVYLLEEQADGSTRLRHVIDTAAKVREALESDPDPWKAIDALTTLTATAERETLSAVSKVVNLAMGLFAGTDLASLRDLGAGQIAQVKRRAEKSAKKAS